MKFLSCVCVCVLRAQKTVATNAHVCSYRDQNSVSGAFSIALPYCSEAESLIEPGAWHFLAWLASELFGSTSTFQS